MSMRLVRQWRAVPASLQGAVVALGNFDGVHLGHRAILDACVQKAAELSRPAAVMTFFPHPRAYFRPDAAPLCMTSVRRKIELFDDCGVELVFLVRFDAAFAGTSAEGFVREVLGRALKAAHVVTGYNFAFGKGRGGDTTFLAQACAQEDIGYTACPPVHRDGMAISSSAVRELLAKGETEKAAVLLGAPYVISGRVLGGDKRGRELGHATANLSLDGLFVSRMGVYAGWLEHAGGRLPAVANLGVRPTFGGDAVPLLEVHALEGAPQLYGQRVAFSFHAFLRDERRFEGPEALKTQIMADCAQARQMLEAL